MAGSDLRVFPQDVLESTNISQMELPIIAAKMYRMKLRPTLVDCLMISSLPMYPSQGRLNFAQAAAVAIKCAPAPVSQNTFVFPNMGKKQLSATKKIAFPNRNNLSRLSKLVGKQKPESSFLLERVFFCC